MKKAKGLLQGNSGLSDLSAAFVLFAGATVLLGGCGDTQGMRASLAPPPPQFTPSPMDLSQNDIQDTTLNAIEPAAGSVVARVPSASLAEDSCLRIGGKGGDALFYQWGDNHLGLGFGGAQNSDTASAQAVLRYRISLQGDAAPAPASGSCLTRRF